MPVDNIANIVGHFSRWKSQLPPKQRSKAPRVRFLILLVRASDSQEDDSDSEDDDSEDDDSDPEGDGSDSDISHIFFPIRWIPYKSPRQLDDPTHPDYAAAHEPTEKDKAKLESWLRVINAKLEGKDPIRRDMFEFTTMKDLHPSDEWRIF